MVNNNNNNNLRQNSKSKTATSGGGNGGKGGGGSIVSKGKGSKASKPGSSFSLSFARDKKISSGEMKKRKSELKRIEGVRVSMAENKPLLISRLLELKTVGLQVGVDLLVGVNSVTRLLEQTRMNSLSRNTSLTATTTAIYNNTGIVVCLARDVQPANLHRHIIDICKIRKVPLVIIPRLSQDLVNALNIRSATCFAVLSSDNLGIYHKVLNEK